MLFIFATFVHGRRTHACRCVSVCHTSHRLTQVTLSLTARQPRQQSGPVCLRVQSRPRPATPLEVGRALTVSLALLFFFTLLINVTDKPDVVGISATPHTSPLFTCLPWSTACYALSTLRTTIFLTEATTLSLAESTFAHEMRLPTLTQTKMLPTTPTSLAQRAGASARA